MFCRMFMFTCLLELYEPVSMTTWRQDQGAKPHQRALLVGRLRDCWEAGPMRDSGALVDLSSVRWLLLGEALKQLEQEVNVAAALSHGDSPGSWGRLWRGRRRFGPPRFRVWPCGGRCLIQDFLITGRPAYVGGWAPPSQERA